MIFMTKSMTMSSRMEYDKLAVNNQVYSWSEALGEVVDPRGARVVPGRDGSVSPQRSTRWDVVHF